MVTLPVVPQLRELVTAGRVGAETEVAQRFLLSAFESVDAVLETLEEVRTGGRGRLTSPQEDLLSKCRRSPAP